MHNTKSKLSSVSLYIIGSLAWLVIIGLGAHRVFATPFIQSYTSSKPLQQGLLVGLEANDANGVVPATQLNIYQTTGVVVDQKDASIDVSNTNSGSQQQVFVATNGRYNVLVSNENGPIDIGDYLTVSSLNGVAMKADTVQPIVVGQSLAKFYGIEDVVGTATIRNSNGSSKSVTLGLIPANILINRNPYLVGGPYPIPTFLAQVSQQVSGKVGKSWQIYIGVIILVGSVVIAGVILYSGVRNSIVAIGRNPLSKKSIFRTLSRVILTALIIFISGIFGVYLLLRV